MRTPLLSLLAAVLLVGCEGPQGPQGPAGPPGPPGEPSAPGPLYCEQVENPPDAATSPSFSLTARCRGPEDTLLTGSCTQPRTDLRLTVNAPILSVGTTDADAWSCTWVWEPAAARVAVPEARATVCCQDVQ